MLKNRPITIKEINMKDALRYLGYGDNIPDENMQRILDSCQRDLLNAARPDYVYKIFDINENCDIEDCEFQLVGEDIRKHLKGCDKVAFMCVTISSDVDKLIRRNQITSMTNAIIIDAMASAMVEQVCDQVEDYIRAEFSDEYSFTWRFGLGYGDFPLEGQKQFLDVLNAPKQIGVCVNDGLMLTPTKSVTCIIGIGKNKHLNSTERGCNSCNFRERCQYRTRGINCGH